MPDDALDKRLENALRRRTELIAQIERIKGKKEAAESNLKAAEDACRSRKVDPDNIEGYIEKLHMKYDQVVTALEDSIDKVTEQLAPFLENEDEDRSS